LQEEVSAYKQGVLMSLWDYPKISDQRKKKQTMQISPCK